MIEAERGELRIEKPTSLVFQNPDHQVGVVDLPSSFGARRMPPPSSVASLARSIFGGSRVYTTSRKKIKKMN
jgi:hypothetical protein